MKTEWFEMIERNIESQKSLIYKKDIKFYQIDKLLKFASKVENFSKKCKECNQMKSEIEYISSNIENLLTKSMKSKKEYESRFDNIANHLKNEHKIYSSTYFSSLYSMYGTVAGLTMGFLFGYLFFKENLYAAVLIFWAIGIIVGRFFGIREDKLIKRENRNI